MRIGPSNIRFFHQETLLFIIPTDRVFDWRMTEVVGGAAQAHTLSKTRVFREA